MYYGLLGLAGKVSAPAYGTLTTAWITATGETDATIIGALNTLETDLTTYGLISKMKALYPMVGGTSTKHSYNFMNTAQYQLTFNGGGTHSSTGYLPNGTNGYADTGLKPSTNLSSINSIHLSYYSRTNSFSGSRAEMGGWKTTSGDQTYLMYSFNDGITRYVALNSNGQQIFTYLSDTLNHLIISRVDNSTVKTFKNGTLNTSTPLASSVITDVNMYLGGFNSNGTPDYFSNKECAFASIGDGLTDTEAANFYTAVQAFQTSLTRQV